MKNTSRLELTWIGKNVRPKLEPRILLEDPTKSYHAPHRVTDKDIFDNRLIHGDNLLALKALEQEFTGKVKCIYIDPPYNTGSAFEHYDDGVEHSLWLSLMRDRLVILRNLLREDGSLWISIDDKEMAYLKVVCDELFGRENYLNTVTWQRKYSVSNNYNGIASVCDYLLVFSKSNQFKNNLLPRTQDSISRYTNPDNDPRGPWKAVDYLNQAPPHKRRNLCYDIVNPNTGLVIKNTVKAWKYDPTTHAMHIKENRLWWGLDGKNTAPALKLFLAEVRNGMTPHDWWPHEDVGHTDEAKKENIALFGAQETFDTPKPERLIQRVLHIATNPGDLVLDSFLGSGTTAAVAHKMGRRWIGIELGEHCYTHCIPRLQKVINGEDPGGITKAQNWQGGGGFRFYELAPSLIKLDPWDIPVINPAFNAEMLAEAVCKLHGYRYAPSPDWFWMHGEGHKDSHIFVTTQTLTTEIVQYISDQVGEARSLLICCPPCPEAKAELFSNLTLSIMPNVLLKRYEWDHDDYSLNVKNLPQAEPTPCDPPERMVKVDKKKKRTQGSGQASLLDLPKGDAQ